MISYISVSVWSCLREGDWNEAADAKRIPQNECPEVVTKPNGLGATHCGFEERSVCDLPAPQDVDS
jgi:hypothetical protein